MHQSESANTLPLPCHAISLRSGHGSIAVRFCFWLMCRPTTFSYQHRANTLWTEVLKALPPRGPCNVVHWLPTWLNCDGHHSWVGWLICLVDTKLILPVHMTRRLAWSHYVHGQVCHHKGIAAMPVATCTQINIFTQLTDREQKLISLYITAAVKATWDNTQSVECPYCSQTDTHLHRLLYCPEFAHVRDKHTGP